jgi:hypothetical protein
VRRFVGLLATLCIAASVPALGQQAKPSMMSIAQAQDRCMTTFAVRLSRETTDDEAIFERALNGCSELDAQLDEAISREVPAEKQQELRAMLAESRKPNFMAMLAKIRSDRAAREAND